MMEGDKRVTDTDSQIAKAVNLFNTTSNSVKSTGTHIEFEIRMRALSRDDFTRFVKILADKAPVSKPERERSIEAISSSRYEKRIRKIVFEKGGRREVLSRKKSVFRYIMKDKPVSLNISEEEDFEKMTLDRLDLIRVKNRLRFRYPEKNPKWYVDVTISKHIPLLRSNHVELLKKEVDRLTNSDVSTISDPKAWVGEDGVGEKSNYEVEFEFIGDHISAEELSHMLAFVDEHFGNQLVEYGRHASYKTELGRVYSYLYDSSPQYSRLSMKKTLPSVVTLTRKKYKAIFPPVNYFVTDKADGVRALAVLKNRTCTIIADDLYTFPRGGGSPDDKKGVAVILDGEFLKEAGVYLAFDLIALGDEKMFRKSFAERLEQLPNAVKLFNCDSLAVRHKSFFEISDASILKDQLNRLKKNMETSDYDTDGVIFTPSDRDYLHTVSYKWKDQRNLTIDFLAKLCPESVYLSSADPYVRRKGFDLYFLFVGIQDRQMSSLGIVPCPGYSELFPDLSDSYGPVQFSPSTNPYAYLYWFDSRQPSIDNKIVELRCADLTTEFPEWEFVRVRDDKSGWPNPEYNNFMIAEETWMLLLEGFAFDELCQPSGSYFAINKEGVHKYHAAVTSMFKGTKIMEFAGSQWVVDMGVGQGQDIRRYMDAGVSYLVGVDSDRSALSTLIERKYDFARDGTKGRRSGNKSSLSIRLVCSDASDPAVIEKMRKVDLPESGADLVVSNLSISYFCSDLKRLRKFLTVCATIVNKDGAIVVTTFSGRDILTRLNESGVENGHSLDLVENGSVKFSIRRRFDSDELLPAGQKVETLLPFSAGDYYEEYLVNTDEIISSMSKLGFGVEVREMKDFIADAKRANDDKSEIIKKLSPVDVQWLSFQTQLTFRRAKSGGGEPTVSVWEIARVTNGSDPSGGPAFNRFVDIAQDLGVPRTGDQSVDRLCRSPTVATVATVATDVGTRSGGQPGTASKYAYVLVLMGMTPTTRESGKYTKYDRYAVGACMMAGSISHHGGTVMENGDTADIVCMYSGTFDDSVMELLGHFFDKVVKVEEIARPTVTSIKKTRFRDRYLDWLDSSFTKINALTLTDYEKILFLDADMLCLKNPSGAFSYDTPAGVVSSAESLDPGKEIPAMTIKKSLTDYGSYGVGGFAYLLTPSREKYDESINILDRFTKDRPYNTSEIVKQRYALSGNPVVAIGPDELFMTLLYPKWYYLGAEYGTAGWKRTEETIIIHFVTMKPWDEIEKKGEPVYADFELWYKFTSMYVDKFPTLRDLILSGDRGEEILRRIHSS